MSEENTSEIEKNGGTHNEDPPAPLELTEARLKALKTEKDRTGIGAYRLFQHAEDPPEGLNAILIGSWFYSDVATARVDHFNYVLRLWRSLPDTNIVQISEEQRRHMLHEATREATRGLLPMSSQTVPTETGNMAMTRPTV